MGEIQNRLKKDLYQFCLYTTCQKEDLGCIEIYIRNVRLVVQKDRYCGTRGTVRLFVHFLGQNKLLDSLFRLHKHHKMYYKHHIE